MTVKYNLLKRVILLIIFFTNNIANALDLTVSRTIEMIQAESHDLKKSEANFKKAKAGLDAVNANKWFKLDASASYMHSINVENPGENQLLDISMIPDLPQGYPTMIEIPSNLGMIGLNLTWPIYTFGRIENAITAAENAVKMADIGSDIVKREITMAATQIYWAAKMSLEIVKIAEDNLKSSITAKTRLENAGRSNISNLVKIAADIATKEITLSDAKFNQDSAYRLLKTMAGINESEQLTLTDEFPTSFKELTAQKELESTPEWDLLESQVNMLSSKMAASKAEKYPLIATSMSYNYMAFHTNPKLWQGTDGQSASISLAVSIPLWNGGATNAKIAMDKMETITARHDLEKSKKMKKNEYEETILKHAKLLSNLTKLNTARDLAKKALSISLDRFTSGQTSAVELSDVQTALMQVDMGILNTKFNIIMTAELVKKLNGK